MALSGLELDPFPSAHVLVHWSAIVDFETRAARLMQELVRQPVGVYLTRDR